MSREVSYENRYLIDNEEKKENREKSFKKKMKEIFDGKKKSGIRCGMQKVWKNWFKSVL